jgi:hypothetical protein
MSGKELKRYEKIRDAAKETGVDASSIVRVCKGKQRYAGIYTWKYTEVKENLIM